jgi:CRISPR-associated exonuclease Cas4
MTDARSHLYAEDQLLPLSGLQHLVFCERQWALIHIEQQWEENRLTAEGNLLHEAAHREGKESRPGIKICRALRLRSLRLGLSGQSDIVEFHNRQPFPVEYKRGKPKADQSDRIQLCAQALCLEEMLDLSIPNGALFYGTTRRRQDVIFDQALRHEVQRLAERMHDLYRKQFTPIVEYAPNCDNCSLIEICLPQQRKDVSRYLFSSIRAAIKGPEEGQE